MKGMRDHLANQIQKGLRENPEPSPGDPFRGFRDKDPTPVPTRTVEDRIQGLTEQIKRDTAVLKGKKTYIVDRQFYEDRIAGTRETILQLSPDMAHLKRENAIPATPPAADAEPRKPGIGMGAKEGLEPTQTAFKPDGSKKEDRSAQKRASRAARLARQSGGDGGGGGKGQKRVPAGSDRGGEWTK